MRCVRGYASAQSFFRAGVKRLLSTKPPKCVGYGPNPQVTVVTDRTLNEAVRAGS